MSATDVADWSPANEDDLRSVNAVADFSATDVADLSATDVTDLSATDVADLSATEVADLSTNVKCYQCS